MNDEVVFEHLVFRNPPELFGSRDNQEIAHLLDGQSIRGGWELAAMCQDGFGKILVVFKRPIREVDGLVETPDSDVARERTYVVSQHPEGIVPRAEVRIFTSDYEAQKKKPPNPDADAHWEGMTDDLGVARDRHGSKPFLKDGTYYIYLYKRGYNFLDLNPHIFGPEGE